ncbi:hypothetical protein RHSIM_Rhsim12G0181900 [Rhododendron simsii]|uniref:Uncharacterized protein n=1 Tax=Rhododendron simsii TaxID=118357 RepID=A0A834L6Y9_RHOSS|nr:hypothetical protein RHSIM_Rhsim12G0181900 [Rhododendron simsii]
MLLLLQVNLMLVCQFIVLLLLMMWVLSKTSLRLGFLFCLALVHFRVFFLLISRWILISPTKKAKGGYLTGCYIEASKEGFLSWTWFWGNGLRSISTLWMKMELSPLLVYLTRKTQICGSGFLTRRNRLRQ